MSKQLPTPVDFSWSRCSSSQFSSLTWTTATTTSSLRRYPTSSHPSSSHIDVHHIKIIFPHTSVLFDYFRITWMLTEHTDLWPQLASRFKFIKPLRSWCKYTEVLHPIFPSLLRRHAGPSCIKELPPRLIKVFSIGSMTKPLSHHHLHFPPADSHMDAQIQSSAARQNKTFCLIFLHLEARVSFI